MSEKEKLSTIFEETSSGSTQGNLQEECAQELHETYVSFEGYSTTTSTDEASNINPSSPPLPPGLLKPQISIRLGLYTKVKSNTWDRYATESTPRKPEPNTNSSRSTKSINLSRLTSLFRTGSTTSSSSMSTMTSDHDHDHDEMLALRERVAAAEILVEMQQQEIATLRDEAAETRIMLQDLKAQMAQLVESQAPAIPPLVVASCDLVDLLSF